MDKKFGFYICSGCGIGDALDIKGLIEEVPEEEGYTNCKTHPFLCSQAGVNLIKKDVEDGVNTIVIGACSRRVNWDVFKFDNCIVQRVNLREGVCVVPQRPHHGRRNSRRRT